MIFSIKAVENFAKYKAIKRCVLCSTFIKSGYNNNTLSFFEI